MMWDHQQSAESKHGRAYLVTVHIAFGVVMAGLLALVFGYFVMLLWNAVMPAVIAARSITYWQSVALLAIARILIGGLGCHGSGHGRSRQRSEAWREYDEWWRATGKKSFEESAGGGSERKGA
jgi:hypothetical protein